MARYMGELGLTPVARARLDIGQGNPTDQVTKIELVMVYTDGDGNRCERPLDRSRGNASEIENLAKITTYELYGSL